MSTVDEVLNYKRKEEEDFYGLLGCDENSSVSVGKIQINKCFPICSGFSVKLLSVSVTLFEIQMRNFVRYFFKD